MLGSLKLPSDLYCFKDLHYALHKALEETQDNYIISDLDLQLCLFGSYRSSNYLAMDLVSFPMGSATYLISPQAVSCLEIYCFASAYFVFVG